MRWLDTFRLRLRSLVRRGRVDAELDREMLFHLEQQIAENVAAGMAPGEARTAARRTVGNLTQIREQCRDARGLNPLDHLHRDAVLALRTFRRSPTFTTAAVVTLALGIGATTAVYSAVDAAFFRPLPFPQPDHLVRVREVYLPIALGGGRTTSPGLQLTDLQAMTGIVHHAAAYATGARNLGTGPEPRRVTVTYVTGDFFVTLGRDSVLGRVLRPQEAATGAPPVTVLSDRLWRGHFGGDPAIVGKTVMLDDQPHRVVGVMPRDFRFPASAELWVPLPSPVPRALMTAFRNFLPSEIVARLAPGVTPQAAKERIEAARPQLAGARAPAPPATRSEVVVPLQRSLVGDRRIPLAVLMASAAVVLLIACANAATLLLSRADARRRELATHAALGATRGRLLIRLLVENMMLATAGAGLGLALASGSLAALSALVPPSLAPLAPVQIDWRVLAFSLAVTLTTGLVFGLWPAIGTSRVHAGQVLTGAASHGATGSTRTRRGLVVAQIALACVLVTAAGLMLTSLRSLLTTDVGMQLEHVVSARLSLPSSRYPNGPAVATFTRAVLERVAASPAIEAAAAINTLPFGQEPGISIRVDTAANAAMPPLKHPFAPLLVVTPDYFRTMGIRVVRGRTLAWTDDKAVPVAVVNRTLARQLGAGDDVIGLRIDYLGPRTIVGIVEDARIADLSTPIGPQAYMSMAEQAQNYLSLVVRGRDADEVGDRLRLIRDAVLATDKAVPLYAGQPMEDVLATTTAPRLANTWLIGVFGALSLSLAIVGIYGVLAYSVAQRTREIGIRVALGARRRSVLGLVVRQGLTLAFTGIVLGMSGALAATRYLEGMLHGVGPRDPTTFLAVPLLFALVAVLASCIPARQAATVDAMRALRTD